MYGPRAGCTVTATQSVSSAAEGRWWWRRRWWVARSKVRWHCLWANAYQDCVVDTSVMMWADRHPVGATAIGLVFLRARSRMKCHHPRRAVTSGDQSCDAFFTVWCKGRAPRHHPLAHSLACALEHTHTIVASGLSSTATRTRTI